MKASQYKSLLSKCSRQSLPAFHHYWKSQVRNKFLPIISHLLNFTLFRIWPEIKVHVCNHVQKLGANIYLLTVHVHWCELTLESCCNKFRAQSWVSSEFDFARHSATALIPKLSQISSLYLLPEFATHISSFSACALSSWPNQSKR